MPSILSVGTGYLTACFAMMLGPEGRALGVEHIAELVDFSINNIKNSAASSFLKEGSLSMHIAGMLNIAFLMAKTEQILL